MKCDICSSEMTCSGYSKNKDLRVDYYKCAKCGRSRQCISNNTGFKLGDVYLLNKRGGFA